MKLLNKQRLLYFHRKPLCKVRLISFSSPPSCSTQCVHGLYIQSVVVHHEVMCIYMPLCACMCVVSRVCECFHGVLFFCLCLYVALQVGLCAETITVFGVVCRSRKKQTLFFLPDSLSSYIFEALDQADTNPRPSQIGLGLGRFKQI